MQDVGVYYCGRNPTHGTRATDFDDLLRQILATFQCINDQYTNIKQISNSRRFQSIVCLGVILSSPFGSLETSRSVLFLLASVRIQSTKLARGLHDGRVA